MIDHQLKYKHAEKTTLSQLVMRWQKIIRVNTTKNINVAHLTNVKISNILIKFGIIKYSVQQRERERERDFKIIIHLCEKKHFWSLFDNSNLIKV